MRLYKQDWFIWLSLVLLPPLGIILLWVQKKYRPVTRIILTAISAIIFIFILLPTGDDDAPAGKVENNTSTTVSSSLEATEAEIPETDITTRTKIETEAQKPPQTSASTKRETEPQKPPQTSATPVERTVYWVPDGKSYHYSRNCSTLSRSKTILSGTLSQCPKSDPCDRCVR